eukprot:TRINITY_DN18731_c0_g1_i1.p1 TRINITY_DN18731_c0_g1~~TRINITY_DN18731_c0_g1_i1.p1  ORF type:complete len:181 (+),score=16.52 TRINITY_DN18731_c0_g1_i1:55-597(+)
MTSKEAIDCNPIPSKNPDFNSSSTPKEEKTDTITFECDICFDVPSDPVVTICGHLFCWPCLFRWLEIHESCPVCKSPTNKEKVIPIYGRGKEQKDPRSKIPSRPSGQRVEPEPSPFDVFPSPFTVHFGSITVATGLGLSSFGHLPFLMNNAQRNAIDDQTALSRIFSVLGILFVLLFLLV